MTYLIIISTIEVTIAKVESLVDSLGHLFSGRFVGAQANERHLDTGRQFNVPNMFVCHDCVIVGTTLQICYKLRLTRLKSNSSRPPTNNNNNHSRMVWTAPPPSVLMLQPVYATHWRAVSSSDLFPLAYRHDVQVCSSPHQPLACRYPQRSCLNILSAAHLSSLSHHHNTRPFTDDVTTVCVYVRRQ